MMSRRMIGLVAWWLGAMAIIAMPMIAALGATPRIEVAVAESVVHVSQTSRPAMPDDFAKPTKPTGPRGGAAHDPPPVPSRGLRLVITGETVASSDEATVHDVTLHVTTGCPPCVTMKRALQGDTRLRVTESMGIPSGVPLTTFPFITFRDSANVLRYNGTARTADAVVSLIERTNGVGSAAGSHSGRMTRRLTPDELRHFARGYTGATVGVEGMTVRAHLMDSRHGFTGEQLAGLSHAEMLAVHSGCHHGLVSSHGAGSVHAVAAGSTRATGVAGSIQGREVIRSALDWWRNHVGDGTASVEWTRNGSQMLPLMRLRDWTPKAIYGTSGSFQFQLTGAPHTLPVSEALIDYRLVGGQLRLRGETSIDAGLFGIDTNRPKAVAGEQPVGVSPMLILSGISMVMQLLNPQADLTLPGSISASATMHGDELLVTFRDAPSVRLVMLFTFTLRVESVAISKERVTVNFAGSRWIKSRSFEVQ